MKLSHWIENLLLPLTVGIALLLELGDTFNWFGLIGGNPSPTFLLLLCTLIFGALSIMQKQLREIGEHLQQHIARKTLESMQGVPMLIHPELRKVLKDDYFEDLVAFLLLAISEAKVLVSDAARFRHYCIRMFKCYPKALYLLTCPVNACYLWEDPALENALSRLLRAGGKARFVLIARNAQELGLSTTQAVVNRLQQLGIQCHIRNGTTLPADLKKFFIVESRGKIAWELTLNSEGDVEEGLLTANKRMTTVYIRSFEKLWGSELPKKPKRK